MSRVAVVGNDILAVAVARQLASGPATVVLHPTVDPAGSGGTAGATLRLLHQDQHRVARDNAALRCWEALEEETGVDVLSPAHAIDVGPPETIAMLLQATSTIAPTRVLFPAEATRQWRTIRFDGLVAYQPAACRISLPLAHQAMRRSAAAWGVQLAPAAATRARTGPLGDVEVLAGGRWLGYDAAVVIADSTERSELLGLPTTAELGTVLSVEPIGEVGEWPSIVHHAGLTDPSDGHRLPECGAEFDSGLLDLTLAADGGRPDAAHELWEYATRWLPGTIVGTKRVRSQRRSVPRLDTTLGRLAVTAPLGVRDVGLAPVVAAELTCDLFNAVDLDRAVARAS